MYLELIRFKKYRTRNRLSTNRWYCGGPLRLYKKCHRGNLNFDKNSRNVLELHREINVQKMVIFRLFLMKLSILLLDLVNSWTRTNDQKRPFSFKKLEKINEAKKPCMSSTLEHFLKSGKNSFCGSRRTKVSRTIVLMVLKSYLNRFMVSISGINPKSKSWFMG